jgi:hypothetical protein
LSSATITEGGDRPAVQQEVVDSPAAVRADPSSSAVTCNSSFGNSSEMASNRQKDMELSMLCLHLLQICLAYVNTLMIQQVLTERQWAKRLTKEDLRALTPLIYAHVNPYGILLLDMRARLSIESAYKAAA